jgi:bifunctional DNA-binding transcriptional regulator/antitoxin component of YhaV-PrlF toxin-antitoxin module
MNVMKVLRHGRITLPKTLREVLDIKVAKRELRNVCSSQAEA